MENLDAPNADSTSAISKVYGQSNTGLASWILPEDKIPIFLTFSIYSFPIKHLEGYYLFSFNSRVALWINRESKVIIVGLKGTSSSTKEQDLSDDLLIMTDKNYCGSLSICDDATKLLDEYNSSIPVVTDTVVIGVNEIIPYKIIFVGHSLGGTGALCMVPKYENSRAISINGGAPPTNPTRTGPGPSLATHYHIVGDLISSHMYPQAARVIRVKLPGMTFGSLAPHNGDNVFKEGKYYTADEEDQEYRTWGYGKNLIYSVVSRLLWLNTFAVNAQVAWIVYKHPIPGSSRDY